MIHLFHKNKFGRNVTTSEEEKMIWRSFFKVSEDSLSASVFGLLCYLPVETLWKIIGEASYHFNVISSPTRLLSYEFWPHWDNTGTDNVNFVEPDIFIEFDNCDVIIEAKRFDYIEHQDRRQWRKEIIAYLNEHGEKDKKAYFIAVSGLSDISRKQDDITEGGKTVTVMTTGWKRILKAVQKAWDKEQKKQLQQEDSHLQRVLEDILRAFSLHEFFVGSTLDTLTNDYKIDTISFPTARFSKYCFRKTFPRDFRNLQLNLKTLKKWQLSQRQN